jgi:hypothetical protein
MPSHAGIDGIGHYRSRCFFRSVKITARQGFTIPKRTRALGPVCATEVLWDTDLAKNAAMDPETLRVLQVLTRTGEGAKGLFPF